MSKRGSGSSTRASSEKTTLDEFLAKRGLSSPISDYMDDKMRIPHGLTRRQTEKCKGKPTRPLHSIPQGESLLLQNTKRALRLAQSEKRAVLKF